MSWLTDRRRLAVTDALLHLTALRDYDLPPSVRGDLVTKLGRFAGTS